MGYTHFLPDKQNLLESLFVDELKDLYDAEKQLVQALPKMAEAASSDDLKRGFRQHLEQTQDHVRRLEDIFDKLGEAPDGKKCYGMQGIIQESEQLLQKQDIPPDVKDAGLIAQAQKAEHYEIACYGTVRQYAQELGYDEAAKMLNGTLDEESKTDERLTSMAVGHINIEAIRTS